VPVLPENRENNREKKFFSRSGAGFFSIYDEISAYYANTPLSGRENNRENCGSIAFRLAF
jgi:hypothetical protein